MNANLVPVLQTIVTILAIFAMIWKFRKDLLTEVDKKFDAFKVDIDHRFDAIDQRFEAVDQRFEAMDRRFDAMDRRFDAMDRRLDKIEATLETVQQNHLDHITQLHVSPHGVASTTDTPENSS